MEHSYTPRPNPVHALRTHCALEEPEALIAEELTNLRDEDRFTTELVFRDPYFLDFLGLRDTTVRRIWNRNSTRNRGISPRTWLRVCLYGRQKRITLDGDDFYMDLLFYHRRLRRLVVIELKIGDFRPADTGQVELYLRWLDKYERQPGEEPPIGIILCAGKKQEQVELLELGKAGIHVAEYWTELPPRRTLAAKAPRRHPASTCPSGPTWTGGTLMPARKPNRSAGNNASALLRDGETALVVRTNGLNLELDGPRPFSYNTPLSGRNEAEVYCAEAGGQEQRATDDHFNRSHSRMNVKCHRT